MKPQYSVDFALTDFYDSMKSMLYPGAGVTVINIRISYRDGKPFKCKKYEKKQVTQPSIKIYEKKKE